MNFQDNTDNTDSINTIKNTTGKANTENTASKLNADANIIPDFKSGFVAVVGRPSVGKSTFINYITKHNVSITSKTPQTTRHIIRAIINRENFQLILLDTPGLHTSENKYGKHLTSKATEALSEADAILYMLDATRSPASEETAIAELLKKYTVPIFVAINKLDVVKLESIEAHKAMLKKFLSEKGAIVYFISAVEGTNIESLLTAIAEVLPTHQGYYPSDYYTDQAPAFRICEQIRAVALDYVKEELPHALYVEIIESSVKNVDDDGKPTHLFVRAQLVVERESQKAILIGKQASMVRNIRINAMKRLTSLFDYKIQLELRVIVSKKWRNKPKVLDAML